MKNINWIKIAGILAVVGLVFLSLFSFTSFIRKLPEVKMNLLVNLLLTLGITVSAIYYISKTNYGSTDSKVDTLDEQ